MLFTSIETFHSQGGGVSSSLRNITQEEINDYLSITNVIFSFEGRRSVICWICLLLKSQRHKDIEEELKMTRVISGVSMDFNKGWKGRKIWSRWTHFICAHVLQTQKKITRRKKNYLSVSWSGSRIKDLSAVSSQWRFSNVVLFVILEPFHSAPLLSLYWRSTVRGEWCFKRSMSSAHTCSNEEVMLLTSIKIFLSHGGGVSSSLTKFHAGGSQRSFEYHKSHFKLWRP